jgi:hypothetical protein
LVVDWNAQSAANVVAQLSALGLKARAPVDPAGLADPKMRKAWLEEKGMMVFTFVDPTNPLFVVDLFLEPPLPFEELWSRSRCTEIGSSKVRIAGIADLIALKTRSGRPQDLADIEALEELRKNADHG